MTKYYFLNYTTVILILYRYQQNLIVSSSCRIEVEVSFTVKRNVFINAELIGTSTLDGTEYSVLAA